MCISFVDVEKNEVGLRSREDEVNSAVRVSLLITALSEHP
jgi:hypothetical protein